MVVIRMQNIALGTKIRRQQSEFGSDALFRLSNTHYSRLLFRGRYRERLGCDIRKVVIRMQMYSPVAANVNAEAKRIRLVATSTALHGRAISF